MSNKPKKAKPESEEVAPIVEQDVASEPQGTIEAEQVTAEVAMETSKPTEHKGFPRFWKSKKFWKLMMTLSIIASVTTGAFFLFRALGLNDEEGLRQTLDGLGIWLYVAFIGLFITQALVLSMVPGNTTLFVGVAFLLFDNFFVTLLVCSIAIVLSSMVLYTVGRYGGRRLLYWLFGKEAVQGKLEWISHEGQKAIPWLFLIPVMPNDLMVLVCGASKMRFWQFMLIIIVFRPMEVALLILYAYVFSTVDIMDVVRNNPLEVIIVINLLIIDLVLLGIYHKNLLRLFKKNMQRVKRTLQSFN